MSPRPADAYRPAPGGHRDLDRIFDDVLDHSVALFGADKAGLWAVEDLDHPFRLASHRGLGPAFLAVVAEIERGSPAAGWRAVVSRRTVVLQHPWGTGTTAELAARYDEEGFRTICLVPVAYLDEPLGLLVLYHTTPHEWAAAELDLVESFADQVAVSLQNARLYADVRDFAARLDAIQDLASRLNRLHDQTEIGQAIVVEARGLFASDTARVYRVDHAAGMCEPIAFGGTFLGVSDPAAEILRVPIGTGLTGWVAAHNTAVRVADTRTDPRRLIVGPDGEAESMLLAPMTFEDVVLGVVVVSKKGADRYDEDDLATLRIFAGFAAQALVNAENIGRLREQQQELEHRLASQRALLDVNETLLGAGDPSLVLERIADGLRSVVRYDNLTIYRIDRARGVRTAVLARDRYAEVILAEEIPTALGLTGWATENGEALLANDAHLDPRAVNIPGTPMEPESLIVVPLRVGGDVIGTLNVGRMGETEAHFSPDEFELVKLFAGQASTALQTAEALHAAALRAERDALTGLRNHGAFQADLEELLAGGADGGPAAFALLMLDLDGFKSFNDGRGHPAGDRLLRRVADALPTHVRAQDRAFRYGGDEFAVLLPEVPRAEARVIADRLAAAVDEIGSREDGPHVTVSIGVAACPADGTSKDELVMLADAELYLEKAARRKARAATGGSAAGRGAEYLAAIHETTSALMGRHDPSELLETIVARAATLAGTPNGYLYLVDREADLLRLAVGLGIFRGVDGLEITHGQGVGGRVWDSGEAIFVEDYDAWAGHAPGLDGLGRIGSVVGVPLTAGTEIFGVIGLAAGDSGHVFDETDVAGLSRFAQLASVAMENARLHAAARVELAARARSEDELRASTERLRRLADASFEALVIHRDGRILEVNSAFTELFGRAPDEVLGSPVMSLFPESARAALALQLAIDNETPYETAALLADGSEAVVELIGRTIPYPDEVPARATAIRDIRERRAIQERLARQSFYDVLTGLPNRSLFVDRVTHALGWARPDEATPLAVLLFDLDRFRVINESLGHAVGDQLLVAVGRRLADALRPADTLARLGGDEFAVLVDGLAGEAAAEGLARRMVEALAAPFHVEGRATHVAASVGVAMSRNGGQSAADLLREAEIALYRAKADASDRVAVFHPRMSASSMDRHELELDLRLAIERDELRVHYQPLVDLRTGRTLGHEALVRWEHPTRGLLGPPAFIPLAEETGLILAIDDAVLAEACRQARAWQRGDTRRADLVVSVNISARQFARPDLAARVAAVLAETGLPPATLELEITESLAMSDPAATGVTLRALHELGVRVALDDFGTGYSSLAYLSQLPLDVIKIDRSFVASLHDSPANLAIVRAVVGLAQGLGIAVTAEGIEREDQLTALRDLGCDRGQGFLFARPRPADEAGAALMEDAAEAAEAAA
ncbi:MAG TPA: diguanylate cyclase [Candidatus Nanopelagicales bacterium]|nr:diguanylate cyclase [Candidatus Nanopelagicales bacterium]